MARRAADPVRGLAVADGGLRSSSPTTELRRGTATTLRFRIRDAGAPGARLRRRAREAHAPDRRPPRRAPASSTCTRRCGADGTWSAPITLPDGGLLPRVRRLRARRRRRTRSRADLRVDGAADLRPLPAPATAATATDGYAVDAATRAGRGRRCGFAITRDGEPVDDRALPRRRRPPGRAARGRPRLPARPPDDGDGVGVRGRVPEPRAATGCSCSSSTTAASTRPRSRRR